LSDACICYNEYSTAQQYACLHTGTAASILDGDEEDEPLPVRKRKPSRTRRISSPSSEEEAEKERPMAAAMDTSPETVRSRGK
jgi:hypothetical protein